MPASLRRRGQRFCSQPVLWVVFLTITHKVAISFSICPGGNCTACVKWPSRTRHTEPGNYPQDLQQPLHFQPFYSALCDGSPKILRSTDIHLGWSLDIFRDLPYRTNRYSQLCEHFLTLFLLLTKKMLSRCVWPMDLAAGVHVGLEATLTEKVTHIEKIHFCTSQA